MTDTYVIPDGADIGHVHLKVSSIERALSFYHGVLGFKIVGRFGDRAAFIAAGGYHHHIGLNTWESKNGPPPAPGTTGLYHLAVRYPDAKSLGVAVKRVIESGIPLAGASDHGVSWSVYLHDSDGNGVELTCDVPKEKWPRTETGDIELYMSRPLDLEALLADAS